MSKGKGPNTANYTSQDTNVLSVATMCQSTLSPAQQLGLIGILGAFLQRSWPAEAPANPQATATQEPSKRRKISAAARERMRLGAKKAHQARAKGKKPAEKAMTAGG